jgi:uncharacterized damage-inducible protein DinB
MRSALVAATLLLSATAVTAQQKASGANPAAAGIMQVYTGVRDAIIKAAEQVPEDKYSYKPTPAVRSFGEIVAHIADAQNNICAAAVGNVKPYSDQTEKTAKTKAAIVAAVKASFAACDRAYNGATDATLANATSVFGSPSSISHALVLNASHSWEHYGNLVTYMRMLGMVPPTSQGQ